MSQLAAIVYILGIVCLFLIDRDRKSRTSVMLWIPVLWLLISCSRPVSQWIQPPSDSAELYLDGSPLDRNVFMLLLAASVAVLIDRRKRVAEVLRANGPILLFLCFCGLSVGWSAYPDIAFKRWIKLGGDIIMVVIVLTDPSPRVAMERLLARIGFILLPLSILLIRHFPDLGRAYNRWTWAPSYVGVTTNKNHLGMIAMLCGIAAVWRLCVETMDESKMKYFGRMFAQGALLAMALWLLVIAHSATSLSCFLFGCVEIVAVRLCKQAPSRVLVHLLTGSIVGVAMMALFLDSGAGLIQSLGRDPTLTGRTDIWRGVLHFSGNPLVGTGFESFWLGSRLLAVRRMFENNPLMEAHNGYLEIFLTLGWIGVALLANVIIQCYRNVVSAITYRQESGSLRLAIFIAAVVYNLTESAFKELNPVWLFFLFATVAAPKLWTEVVTSMPEAPAIPVDSVWLGAPEPHWYESVTFEQPPYWRTETTR